MSNGGLKISTRCLTQRPVANQRRLPHNSTQSADLRQARNLPPDGKVTGKPRAGLHSILAKHLPAQEAEARVRARFLFFFSSLLFYLQVPIEDRPQVSPAMVSHFALTSPRVGAMSTRSVFFFFFLLFAELWNVTSSSPLCLFT